MPSKSPIGSPLLSSRIAVAGGGIGGLATALALQQQGYQATVLERAPELKEVGAGLLLAPNAVQVLELLGIRRDVEARARTIREWKILNSKGRCLQRMHPPRDGPPALSIHRADLQFLLLAQLRDGTLQLNAELMSYSNIGDVLNITLGNGTEVEADALIGADGLRSAVRKALLGAQAPIYSGYTGWRGVCPLIPENYNTDFLSESWGEGMRFGIAPMGGRRCYWYATANVPPSQFPPATDHRVELLKRFRNWHAPILELIEATPADQVLSNDIFDRPPLHPWSQGPVTLVGDAAHPMTPNLGQGACMALEDAFVLSHCVTLSSDFPEAFSLYERLRRARTDSIQRKSRFLGKIIQLETPIATALRSMILTATPDFLADLSMRPLFAFKV